MLSNPRILFNGVRNITLLNPVDGFGDENHVLKKIVIILTNEDGFRNKTKIKDRHDIEELELQLPEYFFDPTDLIDLEEKQAIQAANRPAPTTNCGGMASLAAMFDR